MALVAQTVVTVDQPQYSAGLLSAGFVDASELLAPIPLAVRIPCPWAASPLAVAYLALVSDRVLALA